MTFPHLRQYLELGALLGSIYIVQNFDAVFIITSGGLGTANLPYIDLPDLLHRPRLRPGLRRRRRRRHRHDHHRDLRAAHRVDAVPGGDPMSAITDAPPAPATPQPSDVRRRARSRRQRARCSAVAGLGGRHALRHAGAVDGADLVPLRDRRGDQPAVALRAADAGGLQELLRASEPVAVAAELADRQRPVDRPGAAAGLPGRVRPVDPAGAEVDRRAVLLPLDQDAAGRRRPAADLPVRAGRRTCWTTSGC